MRTNKLTTDPMIAAAGIALAAALPLYWVAGLLGWIVGMVG